MFTSKLSQPCCPPSQYRSPEVELEQKIIEKRKKNTYAEMLARVNEIKTEILSTSKVFLSEGCSPRVVPYFPEGQWSD